MSHAGSIGQIQYLFEKLTRALYATMSFQENGFIN